MHSAGYFTAYHHKTCLQVVVSSLTQHAAAANLYAMLIATSLLVLAKPACTVLQVLTMVTLSFTLVGALAGLMGMNLYFAVVTTPLVCKRVVYEQARHEQAA